MFTGTSSLAMAEALPDDGQVGRAGWGYGKVSWLGVRVCGARLLQGSSWHAIWWETV